jgi:hypothetical protein
MSSQIKPATHIYRRTKQAEIKIGVEVSGGHNGDSKD